MFKSKLKATQLTIVDDNNNEYIVHEFEKQGLVVKTKEQLKSAISKLSSSEGTIIVVDNIIINEDITVPENVMLKFTKGGKLTVNSGYTLTLDCAIDAGLFHIFDGDGEVKGKPKIEYVYPQWFGAKGDGSLVNSYIIRNLENFDKIYFPAGIYDFGNNNIKIERDNMVLKGEKGTIIKSSNNDAIVINNKSRDSAISRSDNLPIYQTRPDWNDDDYGGLNPSWTFLHNIIIDNLIIEAYESCLFAISAFRIKNCVIKNVVIKNINANMSNGMRVMFGKDNLIKNIIIEESLNITYGIFVYWSYGTLVEDCIVNKVKSQGIELKHGVKSKVIRCKVYGDGTNPSYGIDFPYGSIDCTAIDCIVDGAERGYGAGSSYEFDYTMYPKFLNCYFNVAKDAFLLERSYGAIVDGCWGTCATFISATQFPYCVGSDDYFSLSTPNSDYYTYDGEYDTTQTYENSKLKYFEYRPYPSLINAKIINCNVKTISNTIVFLQIFDGTQQPVSSMIDGASKLKKFSEVRTSENYYNESLRSNLVNVEVSNILFEESYPVEWRNCTFNGLNIECEGKPSYGIFGSVVSALRDSTISDIKVKGGVGTFLNLLKIENCDILNIFVNSKDGNGEFLKLSSALNLNISNVKLNNFLSPILYLRNNLTGVEIKDGFGSINLSNIVLDANDNSLNSTLLFRIQLASALDLGNIFGSLRDIYIKNALNINDVIHPFYIAGVRPLNFSHTYDVGMIFDNIWAGDRELKRYIVSTTPSPTINSKSHYIGEMILVYDNEPNLGGNIIGTYISTTSNNFKLI